MCSRLESIELEEEEIVLEPRVVDEVIQWVRNYLLLKLLTN